MAQISYIKYANIKEAHRYDADYFKPEYLEIEKRLYSMKHFFLGDGKISFITDGIHASIDFNEKSNILLFSAKAPKENFFDISGLSHISQKQHFENPRTALKLGDIIISTVGTIGNVAVITEDLLPANSDRHVGIIRTKYLSPFFISTFLLTKYGRYQTTRKTVGNVQPNLYIRDLKTIILPDLSQAFQLEIEQIVKLAHQKQVQSKQLYREAEEILLRELGLLDYTVKYTLAFSATKKEIDQAGRYDAEYFQPKYKEIIKKIEKYDGGCDVVGEVVKWKKGIEVGTEAYTETGKDFIRVSDFSIFGISESNRKISDRVFEELKKNYQPRKGEILFTKDGTIGISYVLKEDIEGVLSGAFLRLTLKEKYQDFEKECLSLIFSSILCKMQVEKLSGGALIAHLKPSDFETFKIPLIKPSVQKQIAEKILESHKLRKESKILLEETKRKVEEEIEK